MPETQYPNMPQYQPCPKCHTGAKRQGKTLNGANYYCNKCKMTFFVRVKKW